MRKLELNESSEIFASGLAERMRKQMNKCYNHGDCARFYRMVERHERVL